MAGNADNNGYVSHERKGVSSARKKKNRLQQQQPQRQQPSPVNVSVLTIDVNSPPSPDQSLTSSISSTIPNTAITDKKDKSKRGRRRRKAKSSKGNKSGSTQTETQAGNCKNGSNIDSVSHASNSSRSRNNQKNNNRENNNKNNNKDNNNNSCNMKQQQKQTSSSSFRTPIVSWRNGSNQRRRNNNNNSNNININNSSNHYHHRNQQQSATACSPSPYTDNNNRNYYQHNHSPLYHPSCNSDNHYSSPRSFSGNNVPVCPASMGFPTSKKQHDAPMKKRDLYFSLHVEKVGVGVASTLSQQQQQQQRHGNAMVNNEQQQQKAAARVTLLNWENDVVLDTFVIVPVPVNDYFDTGIRPGDLCAQRDSDNADIGNLTDDSPSSRSTSSCIHSFTDVRSKIDRILKGKILIGYKLDEALQGLGLSHPVSDMRDCLSYFSSSISPSPLEKISDKMLNKSMDSIDATDRAINPNSNETQRLGADDSMIMRLTTNDGISRRPIQICVTTLTLYKNYRQEWEEALITETRERERQQENHLNMIARQRQHEQQQFVQQQQQQQLYRNSFPYVSLHCDFVRTAISGGSKTLARVVVVDGSTKTLMLDNFTRISVPVTDFCNTGIAYEDLVPNSAKPLQILRMQVERLIRGRILVGYKVEEDLKALGLAYPWTHVRDTAYFTPFLREKVVGGSRVVTVRTLDELSEEFLRRRLTPAGERSRSTDVCKTALYLYEAFSDQWERQQAETFRFQNHQQERVVPTTSLSPSLVSVTPRHSPHHQQYHHYRQQAQQYQQPGINTHDASPTLTSPPLLPRQKQLQLPSMREHQDSGPQTRANSSSWFPWVKQNQHNQAQSNQLASVSPILSSQAVQFLQEDATSDQVLVHNNSFLQHDSCSSSSYLTHSVYEEDTATDSRCEGSMLSGDDSIIGFVENSETSALSSMSASFRDDASSIVSSEQAASIVGSPPPRKNGTSSSSSSSWFRFGSRKSKWSSANENKKHRESMASVQESEVLNDDIMMPPITLFPSPQEKEDSVILESKPEVMKVGEQRMLSLEDIPSPSSPQPTIPSRSWLRFRRSSNSPGRKERSRSPPSNYKLDTNLEDLSIATRPEVSHDANTEAIEITLTVPSSVDNEDSISPLTEKPAPHSRSSSSWFSFRRSLKSSSSKNISSNLDSSTKDSDSTSLTKGSVPSLVPSATEPTTAMDEDWFQEVMTLSTAGGDAGGDTGDMSPWLPESQQQSDLKDNGGKPSSSSRDQTSWFGFKWSKASSSYNKASRLATALDSEDGNRNFGGEIDTTWQNHQQQHSPLWISDEAKNTFEKETLNTIFINTNDELNNINGFRPNRTRISTDSTIPSVATEEPSEELLEENNCSESGIYANEFASGAAQSFDFLKI